MKTVGFFLLGILIGLISNSLIRTFGEWCGRKDAQRGDIRALKEMILRDCYYSRTTIQEASERTGFSKRRIAKEWNIADFYGARVDGK